MRIGPRYTNKIRVTYYYRRSTRGTYSIERLFSDVRRALPSSIEYRISTTRFRSRGFLPRLQHAFQAKNEQGDINHITGDIHYVACFLQRKRTLLTIHDCGTIERLKGLSRVLYFLFWYWLPEKRSGIISVVSEATKTELLKYLRCNPKKIRVVPNCISPNFRYSPYSFRENKPLILQIGTKQNKNLLRVAAALSGVCCHLHIVGPLSPKQVEVLHRNRIEYSNSVHISDKEMLRKYKECDLVVFASTYEGFGLPIIEANATGRPVVTSNVLSLPEVAGDAACLVDPFNSDSIRSGILRVIQDSNYRRQLVQNGLSNVKRFSAEAVAAHYVELYEELITGLNY